MSTLFHRNPRLLIVTLFLVIAAGVAAFTSLPRMEDPVLSDRFATVVTPYPGADAQRVESLLTDVIEDELRQVPEIGKLESSSRAGVSIVQIELADDVTETQLVWSRVRARLDDAESAFPPGAGETDFEVQEVQAFTLVAAVVWEGDDEPAHGLLARLGEELEDTLRGVPGTRDTEVVGAADEELRVELDGALAATLGLDAAEVSRRIARADPKLAAGTVRGVGTDLQLEVSGEIDGVSRLEDLAVTVAPDGRVVRLHEIATVRRDVLRPRREAATIDGRVAVAVAARMDPSRRIDDWAAAAHAELETFREALPRGIGMELVFDQSGYTETRFDELIANLVFGAAMVLLVTALMLGWRAALVVGLALPLTALLVLAGLWALGTPLHQFSITGLIIALGLLIDNAIVVVDEVLHRRAEGADRTEAISGAVGMLTVPLLGSTLTTVLAFAPLLLMPGGAGEFVGALSISVILAVIGSLGLSLTVLPTLAVRLQSDTGSSMLSTGIRVAAWTGATERSLRWLMRRPALAVAVSLVFPVLGFVAAGTLTEQFFPPADRDQFQVELRLPRSASLDATLAATEAASGVLRRDERIEHVHWFVGRPAPKFYYNVVPSEDATPSYAQALVLLDHERDAASVLHRAQAALDEAVPGAQVLVRQLEQGPPFNAPVELRITGPDLDTLTALGEEVRARLARIDGVDHTLATLVDGSPKLMVELDDEAARRAGLDNLAIAAALDARLRGAVGGSLVEATERLPVRVRLTGSPRTDAAALASVELPTPRMRGGDGPGHTSLSSLARLELVPELAAIPHRDGERVNSVQAFLHAGLLPDHVRTALAADLEANPLDLPTGYSLAFAGEAAERDKAVGGMLASAGLLVVLMAGSLVLAFRSFRLATLIGAVGLLSTGLALGSVWLGGHPFGFMAIVGAMGLLGVAINDSIVVLTALRDDAAAAAGDPDATAAVVLRSTRHVLATTFTTMAGFVPLMLAGGSFWPPVALAIGGGVAGATLLALVFVPGVNLLLPRRGLRAAAA